MEKIILEVDDNVAKAWRHASIKLKQEITSIMNKQIETIITQKDDKDAVQFLNELRREMADKGFNQKILDSILKGE